MSIEQPQTSGTVAARVHEVCQRRNELAIAQSTATEAGEHAAALSEALDAARADAAC
jgi:hypothetical protein